VEQACGGIGRLLVYLHTSVLRVQSPEVPCQGEQTAARGARDGPRARIAAHLRWRHESSTPEGIEA
jgi:hypothetical protein